MPRDVQSLIFVGIREYLTALDVNTGDVVWRTELTQKDYTNVMWDGETLIASNAGEVYRVDPLTGDLLWQQELKGLGRGLVSLASGRRPTNAGDSIASAKAQRDAAAAAAAAAT
jgi:outer membrane protein assembly factor BamB